MKSSLHNEILKDVARRILPEHITLYGIEGRCLFDVRGSDGGVVGIRVAYLTTQVNGEHFKYCFEFNQQKLVSTSVRDLFEYIEDTIKIALESFLKFLNDPIELEKAREKQRKEEEEAKLWLNQGSVAGEFS